MKASGTRLDCTFRSLFVSWSNRDAAETAKQIHERSCYLLVTGNLPGFKNAGVAESHVVIRTYGSRYYVSRRQSQRRTDPEDRVYGTASISCRLFRSYDCFVTLFRCSWLDCERKGLVAAPAVAPFPSRVTRMWITTPRVVSTFLQL